MSHIKVSARTLYDEARWRHVPSADCRGRRGSMQLIDYPFIKYGFTTRAVPLEEMAKVVPMYAPPRIGDLLLAEVVDLGRHTRMEIRTGLTMHLFPGDHIVGAFGNRYATDQYEGYVPTRLVEGCDLLSVGGVCGEVASQHASMVDPTRLRIVGLVSDKDDRTINQCAFGLPPYAVDDHLESSTAEVILVVGSAMNSGKTTAAGTLARALSRANFSVAAGKITGTAAGKDCRFYEACGAQPVLDFTSAGYPSTYMLGLEELLGIYNSILGKLRASNPDYIILEIADGIFQRETRMLLESAEFRRSADHVFFAASDSLSAESGVRSIRGYGLPVRAIAGAVTQSPLASREAEETLGLPSMSIERIMDGTLKEVLGTGRALEWSARDDVFAPTEEVA